MIALSDRLEKDRWSFGRPVFKKVDGEPRFLFVFSRGTWVIEDSVGAGAAHITSGRATNSPTLSQAGGSVKLGVESWRFVDENGDYAESGGTIDLTCEERSESRKRRDVTGEEEGEWLEGDISVTSP